LEPIRNIAANRKRDQDDCKLENKRIAHGKLPNFYEPLVVKGVLPEQHGSEEDKVAWLEAPKKG
jgi:hypothetical protein